MSRGPVVALCPDGIGEVGPCTDLVELVRRACAGDPVGGLRDGDVVVVTSKVVAKAEDRVVPGTREEHLAAESRGLVARRGPTSIVRTRHGLVLAAAGIDASNVASGSVVLLPVDPDASARRLRAGLGSPDGSDGGTRVAVVVSDTAGRPWREGQTDIAIGAAGLRVLESFAGARDAHGNELAVTAPAVADEVAGLAELATGKLGGRPLTVVRGLADLVLAADDDGPGAAALVRVPGADLFGYGTREAVVRAVRRDPADAATFGAPVEPAELLEVLARAGIDHGAADGETVTAPSDEAVRILAWAHGWEVETDTGDRLRLRPAGG